MEAVVEEPSHYEQSCGKSSPHSDKDVFEYFDDSEDIENDERYTVTALGTVLDDSDSGDIEKSHQFLDLAAAIDQSCNRKTLPIRKLS